MPKINLSSKQTKIYRKLTEPTRIARDLKFTDIDKLLVAMGCRRTRKGGANIVFEYNGHTWGMHKPHPDSGLYVPYVKQVRAFITASGLAELLEDERNAEE